MQANSSRGLRLIESDMLQAQTHAQTQQGEASDSRFLKQR
jgi:hypothetical protein